MDGQHTMWLGNAAKAMASSKIFNHHHFSGCSENYRLHGWSSVESDFFKTSVH